MLYKHFSNYRKFFSSEDSSMSGEREAALRRIAIVLSSLPPTVASRLLSELDANSKQMVRRTMTGLADVDPLERQRALQAFAGSVRKQQVPTTASNDEIVLTSVKRPSVGSSQGSSSRPDVSVHNQQTSSSTSSSSVPRSLELLADMEDDVLLESVSGEHPQTVALLLASIAPAQAARLLPRLDPRLRSEAMGRIGRLGEIPVEMVDELAQHIINRIRPTKPASMSADGRRRLDAILASMPQPLEPSEPVPAARVSRSQQVVPLDVVHEASVSPQSSSQDNETKPLRIAPQTRPETHGSDQDQDSDEHAAVLSNSHGTTPDRSQPLWSTDDIHNHLMRLSAIELRDALGAVDTHDALMALCGLPVETADAVIATLPKPAGREIRLQLASIGSMQLREIDVAKERVAIASLPDQARAQVFSNMAQVRVPMAA
jgi:flagellar motor switch protein FliG